MSWTPVPSFRWLRNHTWLDFRAWKAGRMLRISSLFANSHSNPRIRQFFSLGLSFFSKKLYLLLAIKNLLCHNKWLLEKDHERKQRKHLQNQEKRRDHQILDTPQAFSRWNSCIGKGESWKQLGFESDNEADFNWNSNILLHFDLSILIISYQKIQ